MAAFVVRGHPHNQPQKDNQQPPPSVDTDGQCRSFLTGCAFYGVDWLFFGGQRRSVAKTSHEVMQTYPVPRIFMQSYGAVLFQCRC